MAARTRRNASLVDIGIGVGVLMIIVAGIVWFTSADQPDNARLPDPVQYEAALDNARAQHPYPVLAPEPLPDGWRVTNVMMDPDNPAGHRWRLGMFTEDAEFVGLEQSDGEVASYRDDRLEEFNADGSVTLEGDQWHRMHEDDGDHALVREADGVLTIVRGTVNYDELADIVGALR